MFRNLFRRPTRPVSRGSSFRPRLECLEDRAVPSSTVLTVVPNPGTLLQQVTLTATVTETGTDNVPPGAGFFAKGTVTFFDGAVPLATVPVKNAGPTSGPFSPQGTAVLTISSLQFGNHALSASYSGDSGHLIWATTSPSSSGVLNEVINLPLARVAYDAMVTAVGVMTNNVGYFYYGMSDYLTMLSLVTGPAQQQLTQTYFTSLVTDMILLNSQP